MAKDVYYNFLGTVWDHLEVKDKIKFGELWHSYEQVFATIYQLMVENDLNMTVQDLLPFQIQRWLNYAYDPTKAILRPPSYTSVQDMSEGVRTDLKYLLKFKIDNSLTVEVNIKGANPLKTTVLEIVHKINVACGFSFARGIYEDTIIQLTSPTSGLTSGIEILETSDPTKNACEFVLGVLSTDLPFVVPYYPYAFPLQYPRVSSIPDLRTKIRDDSEDNKLLSSGIDYVLENKTIIAFKKIPPKSLWAKRTYVDEETPWNNFGFLMGIYQENKSSYLSVIQGLWHAFWVGPRPTAVKTSLYLLFGLPVALEDCTVTTLTATTITTTSLNGIIRSYEIPTELVSIVTLGQKLVKFQPLVNGIELYDKINLPGFITTEIGRAGIQRFLTENATRGTGDTDETKALTLLEEHCFLPQISVNAFSSPDINLGNIKLFLSTIRPLHKTFLSQVIVGEFFDKLDLKDKISMHIGIDVTPNLDSNQTTFLDSATLAAYETSDNEGLNLDTDVALMQERVEIEVRSFGILIDSFAA